MDGMAITASEIQRRRLTALTIVRCGVLAIAAYGLYAGINLVSAIVSRSIRDDPFQWLWLVHIAFAFAPFVIVTKFAKPIAEWLVPDGAEPAAKEPEEQAAQVLSVTDLLVPSLRLGALAILAWLGYIVLRLVADYVTFNRYWLDNPDQFSAWVTTEALKFCIFLVVSVVLLAKTKPIAYWLARE